MTENGIYGGCKESLQNVLDDLKGRIKQYSAEEKKNTGIKLVEHLIARIKEEDSMREKCRRRGLPETPRSALRELYDAIGIRVVCAFRDDIYRNVELIRSFPGVQVVTEKDYVKNVKPNGYRSYHMILLVEAPYTDIDGNNPGKFYAEIQLRTIAMDSWAALEHQLKYKKNISNTELIVSELKRCADEMASTDVSMQTIRDLIREDN